jgi:hypothetical protein
MASGAKRGGAGDRVLEGRHVIGLFMLVLLFSAIFFTLGYVMGRSQYDVQVSASSNPKIAGDHAINQKPAPEPKRAVVTPAAVPVAPHTGAAAQTDAGQQNSGWELNDKAKACRGPPQVSRGSVFLFRFTGNKEFGGGEER